jgi:hypothetical protein
MNFCVFSSRNNVSALSALVGHGRLRLLRFAVQRAVCLVAGCIGGCFLSEGQTVLNRITRLHLLTTMRGRCAFFVDVESITRRDGTRWLLLCDERECPSAKTEDDTWMQIGF